jgi:methionyl-tRNA formyltransferase
LINKLAQLGVELLINNLAPYLEGKIKSTPQNHNKATYTKRLTKEDGLIDWQRPIIEIERKIRAMQPWPKAYTILPDGKRLIIYSAKLKSGKLELGDVQLEGRRRMNFRQFRKGYKDKLDFEEKIVYNK